jgi:hypothetical protein
MAAMMVRSGDASVTTVASCSETCPWRSVESSTTQQFSTFADPEKMVWHLEIPAKMACLKRCTLAHLPVVHKY